MKKTLCLIAAAIAICSCGTTGKKDAKPVASHIILIGLDGWGSWCMEKGEYPFIKQMMNEGSWTLEKRTLLPSSSGTNWGAMMNGTPAESSGIISNADHPNFKPLFLTEHNAQPTFFHVLKQARPEAETGVVCEWGDFLNYADTLCLDYFQRVHGPDDVVTESIKYIKEKKPVLFFAHIDVLDSRGHTFGQGSKEYYDELPVTDARIKSIVEGIKEAGIYDDSIIILTSDHGHEGRGQGGITMNEMETPLVIFGKGIKKDNRITGTVIQYDIAATVAKALGLTNIPQSWRGIPIDVFE